MWRLCLPAPRAIRAIRRPRWWPPSAPLVGGREIHPTSLAGDDTAPAHRFNRAVAASATVGGASTHLAAPRVGAGVRVDFTELAAVVAALDGESPEAAAHSAWPVMARTGRRLVRDG